MTPNPQDSAVALEVELLPCPFCGSAPDHIHVYFGEEIVRCSNEACPASPISGGETEAEVFAAWNTRASQSDGTSGGWRPIETAPKDGTRVLAWSNSYGARETYWRLYGDGSIAKQEFLAGKGPSGAWEWSEPQNHWAASWRPTHWQTLAAAPTQSQGDNHVG